MECLSAAPDRKWERQSLSFVAEIADDPGRSQPEVSKSLNQLSLIITKRA